MFQFSHLSNHFTNDEISKNHKKIKDRKSKTYPFHFFVYLL